MISFSDLKVSKVAIIIYLYCFTLLMGFLLPFQIATINFIVLVVFVMVILLLYHPFNYLKYAFFSLLSFFFVFLFTNSPLLSFINDYLLVLLVGFVFYSYSKIFIRKNELSLLIAFVCFYLFYSVMASLFGVFYIHGNAYTESGRFIGLLQSANQSASVVVMFIIILWEYLKKNNSRLAVMYIFAFSIYMYFFFVFQTRTMIFALPYFIYQAKLIFGNKTFFSLLLLAVTLSFPLIREVQSGGASLEDGSAVTRRVLYISFIDELLNSYFVIPRGFGYTRALSIEITGDDAFTPHNDFLRFLIDWGWLFLCFLFIWYRKIKKCMDLNLVLILIFVFSCALHNMLLLYPISISLYFVLIITNNRVLSTHQGKVQIEN